MAPKLPKRSTKALISRRRCSQLAALILACLLDFPGQPTHLARDYSVSVRKVYDIAKCYCRATQYTERHTKFPSNITSEQQLKLATVSPGYRSPLPFIIIGNLLSIPRELQDIADSEQATFSPISRDDIVKDDEDPKYPNGRHPLNSAQSARVLVTPKKRKRDELQQDANIEEQKNPDLTETNSKIKQKQQRTVYTKFDKIFIGKSRANVLKAQRNDDLQTLIREVQEEGIRYGFIADEETLEQYVAKMKNNGESGDGRIFGVICDLYNIKIRIRMPGNIEVEDGKEGKPVIELSYEGHIHYVYIRKD
ncbi:MAG: hypothetical protein EZS28_018215 [Streblomastix strix]|uniref:OTU domain-containing protein n=1 Tax=Streblomastix strix TaxID=222440 RepID=A0A5J4VUG8_9EUKA|nr:MAG: hypothetical protein EZS28_018215 [Streblomastix strix]